MVSFTSPRGRKMKGRKKRKRMGRKEMGFLPGYPLSLFFSLSYRNFFTLWVVFSVFNLDFHMGV